MVLVAVRQDDRANLVAVLEKIGDVRDDDVDAQQFLLGEQDAAVDDDDGVVHGERHHVHPEFAESAQRDYFERRAVHRRSL